MLIRFDIENFLSFNERTEFSLIANKERRLGTHFVKGKGINILKSGVIYGANASGKSNFVKAIDFSRKAIIRGISSLTPSNCHYRLDPNNINKPSIFNYELKIGEKYYSYGFALQLNESKVIEEWLFEIAKKQEKKIFERCINEKGTHEIEIGIALGKEAKKRFDVYRADFQKSDNLLFLSEINRKSIDDLPEASVFTQIYHWFIKTLTVLMPDSKYAGLNFIGDDNELSKTFNSFLSVFNTGITKIISKEIDLEKLDIPKKVKLKLTENIKKSEVVLFEIEGNSYVLRTNENNEYKVKKIGLEHLSEKGKPVIFDIENESDGTQRLFDFIPALHQLAKTNAVFVIDELDRSLHSRLTYAIFELFFKLTANNESQLIATTHEALLLDLELLRRDEIWFIEKEDKGSKLFSLDQFQERSDKVVSKSYLLGRYGAIPIFKNFNHIKF
jgi:uncharacterized protein